MIIIQGGDFSIQSLELIITPPNNPPPLFAMLRPELGPAWPEPGSGLLTGFLNKPVREYPPPLFAMAAEPENGQNPAQHIERGESY